MKDYEYYVRPSRGHSLLIIFALAAFSAVLMTVLIALNK